MTRRADEGRVRSTLIAATDGSPGSFPRGVAGRVVLDRGRAEAGLPTLEAYRGEVFEFRGARAGPRLRQAITDTIRWDLEADEGPIVVEIVPVSGGDVKRLVFRSGATPRRAFVSNLPSDNGAGDAHHRHPASDDDVAALHFGAYYELLEHPPADRPLPRVYSAAPARKGTGLMRPLICTPVWFEQR
jgi:hypothetical protein